MKPPTNKGRPPISSWGNPTALSTVARPRRLVIVKGPTPLPLYGGRGSLAMANSDRRPPGDDNGGRMGQALWLGPLADGAGRTGVGDFSPPAPSGNDEG